MAGRSPKQQVKDHWLAAGLIGAAAAITAALIGALIPLLAGHSTTTPRPPTAAGAAGASTTFSPVAGGIARPGSLTVEDDVYGGAWALPTPTEPRLFPRNQRPSAAATWIENGTVVKLRCAEAGNRYPVVVNLRHESWRWWAQLSTSREWLPMAAFKETKADGPSGLRTCAH